MVTTFERLAKVLKGYIKPANWIERAFASIGSVVSNIPDITNSDRGKFLGVNISNNNLGWKAIRQVPAVGTEDKGKYLKANDSTGELEWNEAGGGGALILHEDENGALDKSWQEIHDACENNTVAVVTMEDDNIYQTIVFRVLKKTDLISGAVTYEVRAKDLSDTATIIYVTDSTNGYPVYTES